MSTGQQAGIQRQTSAAVRSTQQFDLSALRLVQAMLHGRLLAGRSIRVVLVVMRLVVRLVIGLMMVHLMILVV